MFLAKQNEHIFWSISVQKCFESVKSLIVCANQNTENRAKKASILAHDRVKRGMGLAGNVTSV